MSNREPNTKWDSELFLFAAASRAELMARMTRLQVEIPGLKTAFPEFASEWFDQLENGPWRLGIVAKDFADLTNKLGRALDKIEKGSTRIRDISGIYFSETPLGFDDQGKRTKVAFIFPGEGSQYPGMLSDLAELFPHVGEILEWSDKLNQSLKHAEKSTNRFFQNPASFSSEELAEIESDLHRLDFAIYAVFIADWILYSVLERLNVPCDTMGGHSAGEIVALLAARVLGGREEQFMELFDGFRELGKIAPSNAVQSKLIALGASAQTGKEIIDQAAREAGRELQSFVAMKNCPHQSVIVGSKEDTDLVEKMVARRGLVYQQLALEQPYHTPLFEPYMMALRRMMDRMTFYPPQSEIYSCTTGELFPEDPGEIRDLTLAHWELPVQFIDLVENQYRDGVRCFIEVGPRNNLCSFAEDILRGKDALILPTNTARSSGLTQINHVVAQLYVHQFQVDPTFLFRIRNPEEQSNYKFEFETLAEPTPNPLESLRDLAPPQSNLTAGGDREQVMLEHLHVMEQFLAMQQEVMRNYLSQNPLPHPEDPEIPIQESGPDYPMIDEIIELEPGQRIVARRDMDIAEDYFAAQHTIGGRDLSRVAPDQHGLPIVPMTFSIEMLAEAALTLFPGQQVVAMSGIKLFKWLDYDDSLKSNAQVTATVNTELSTESLTILDAKLFHWKGTEELNLNRPVVIARIEVAPHLPGPKMADPFDLVNERPSTVTKEILYQNLFHGEEYLGIDGVTRFGDDGIEAKLHVLPRGKLFSSQPEPLFILDPVTLDVVLHPLCAWHLEQEDQTGRTLLPIGVDRIEFFSRCPEVGKTFHSRAKISKHTARQITHELQVVDEQDQVWCEVHGCHYWRFYLPFQENNFYGPKDVYMLSQDWNIVIPKNSANSTAAQDQCSARLLEVPSDLRNPAMQPITAKVTLSDREFAEFRKLDLPDERRTQWLYGRATAKDAVRALWVKKSGEGMFAADIEIEHDSSGKPSAKLRGSETPPDFPKISIAHSGMSIAAIASLNQNVGIDIEKIAPREEGFLKVAFTKDEIAMLSGLDPEMSEWATRFWCAKEAVGKALGRGLINGPRGVEVIDADEATGILQVKLAGAMLDEFPEFANKAIAVQTSVDRNLAVATTVGETIPLSQLQQATAVT